MNFPNKEKLFEFSVRNNDRKFEHEFVLFDPIYTSPNTNFGNHNYVSITHLFNGTYSRTLNHLLSKAKQGKEPYNINLITLSSFGNKAISEIAVSYTTQNKELVILTHGLNHSKFKLDQTTKIKGIIQPMEELIFAFYK
jgi:hypothetical protein